MVTEKISEYLVAKGISMYAFENAIGASRGSISKAVKENKSIGSQVLENILRVYSDINPDWLLTGRGSMLRDSKISEETKLGYPPIATPISPAEESIIYKMYQEEKADWKAEKKEKDTKIDQLQSELRQQSAELAVLKAKYQDKESGFKFPNITEDFTDKPSGDYGEGYSPTKQHTTSKRSSAGKI